MTIKTLIIFTDGGASGNPGPAAIGVVVKQNGQTIQKISQAIGKATNNVAEYTAVIAALQWLKNKTTADHLQINFYLDSRLVVNQLNGRFKIKDYGLRNLAIKVRQLEKAVGGGFTYAYIQREKNKEADALVKKSLWSS